MDELLHLATHVDTIEGLTQLWVGDSLLASPRLESTVTLAACAAVTKRVRLGLGCMVSLGLRNRVVTAIQWAGLDVLSNGRMTLVACTGPSRGKGVEGEQAIFEMSHREKIRSTELAIEFLRRASSDGYIEYQDKKRGLTKVEIRPAFVQRPLPIWMVANPRAGASQQSVEKALTRVARFGDGWMTFGTDPELLSDRVKVLSAQRERLRQVTPDEWFPICAYVDVNIDNDLRRATQDMIEVRALEGRPFVNEDLVAQTAAVGPVDRCVEFIGKLVRAGATDIALRPVSSDVRRMVDNIADRLLPELSRI